MIQVKLIYLKLRVNLKNKQIIYLNHLNLYTTRWRHGDYCFLFSFLVL